MKLKYWHPTPVFWRKVGDAILGLGTTFTGYEILMQNQQWALVSLVITWLGKTITNFATEDQPQKE